MEEYDASVRKSLVRKLHGLGYPVHRDSLLIEQWRLALRAGGCGRWRGLTALRENSCDTLLCGHVEFRKAPLEIGNRFCRAPTTN